jgi:hypothetical protein
MKETNTIESNKWIDTREILKAIESQVFGVGELRII